VKIRVYYEDTDSQGVVYHTNYLKFCERARSDIFFRHNLPLHFEDQFFLVKKIEAEFIKPAFFSDILEVRTSIKYIKKTSLCMVQSIYKDDEVIFEVDVLVVYVKSKKPYKIPQKFIDMLSLYK